MTFGNRLENVIENLMYSFGTNMASSNLSLMSYEISKLVAKSGIGNILYSAGEALEDVPIIGAATQMLGVALNNAPLIPILMSVFGSDGFISDVWSSLGSAGNALALFNSFGQQAMGSTVKVSGAGTSGSMYVSSGGTSDLLSGSVNSLTELTSSVTTIESDRVTIDENVETITATTTAMLELLTEKLESIDENVLTLAATNNVYSAGWTAINNFVM